jgi:hypothetical protein
MNTTEYRQKVVPVANIDWKELALYFNEIIPVQKKFIPLPVCHTKIREINDFANIIYLQKYKEIFKNPAVPEHKRNELELLRELDVHSVWPIVQMLRLEGVPAIPVFAFRESYDIFGSGENEAIEVKLIDAKLVDAENLEWDQILEFRKDKDAVKDLRNLRLFMFENYKDKSPSYIRDSIEQKIERHHAASKMHGMKLVKTVTSELIESKSSLGCICLATLSHLLGDHVTATTLGVTGAAIAIGKMTINIASEYVSYKTDAANPELAYVIKARKLKK